jgi:hypothetical protein
MIAQKSKTISKTMSSILLVGLLFSCGKKEDLDARRAELLGGDMSNVPKSMKINDVQAQDLAALKTQMYTEGCKDIGAEVPVLKPHSKLKSGQMYAIKSSRISRDIKFQLDYDLRLSSQPAAGDQNIVLQGQIDKVSFSNFYGPILNENKVSVQKKCAILGANSGVENCYDLEIDYSKEFITEYNKVFKDDVECQYGASDEAPVEKWSQGQYALQNSKSVKVFVHTVQTKLNRACKGDKTSHKVIKTVLRVTSNEVVSNQFSHCGGAVVYEKEVLRDHKSNEIISQQTYELIVAPIIEVQ